MANESGGSQLWGCALHARMGKTCCQECEVLVTVGDRQRIAEQTGREDFWEHKAPDNPAYLDQDDDPNWLKWAFRPDGTRPVLKRHSSGDCGFLGPEGCVLSLEIRPIVCRLFPYTYTERGIDGVSDACPKEVIPPGSTILQVLDMRREDADRWHAQLYAELRTGTSCDENRAYLRSA